MFIDPSNIFSITRDLLKIEEYQSEIPQVLVGEYSVT